MKINKNTWALFLTAWNLDDFPNRAIKNFLAINDQEFMHPSTYHSGKLFRACLLSAALLLAGGCSSNDPEPFSASFSWNPSQGNSGQNVTFTNLSKGATAFSWTFSGGTPATSSEENPSIVYSNPGEFDVTLVATREGMEASLTKKITIACGQEFCMPIQSAFTTTTTFLKAGGNVAFTDQTTGIPTSWDWTFDGGTPATSTDQNPTVTYPSAGFYKVTLKASKLNSTDTEIKENYITVGCNGDNCDAIFSTSVKTSDVVYGIDVNQHKLNLFEPENDVSTSRPLIILLGGGAFSGSDLTLLEPLAKSLTSYGFVVAVARYRNGPSSEPAENFIRGQQDLNAAVRYFRKEAAQWKIDPNRIFVGGYGTGAFISLSHAYLDTPEIPSDLVATVNSVGGLEGAQGNAGFSSEALGCISLAGGLYRTLDIIKSDDVPLFAVHGSADFEVPIGTTSGSATLYGSMPIADKTKAFGLLTYLYVIDGGGHDAPRSNPQLYIDQLVTWCHLVMNP